MASETPIVRARITSIFSQYDSIVGPPGVSWLEGARYIPFAGIGHMLPLCDARVCDVALAELVRIEDVTVTTPV